MGKDPIVTTITSGPNTVVGITTFKKSYRGSQTSNQYHYGSQYLCEGFCDLTQAFDFVPYNILLRKLEDISLIFFDQRTIQPIRCSSVIHGISKISITSLEVNKHCPKELFV